MAPSLAGYAPVSVSGDPVSPRFEGLGLGGLSVSHALLGEGHTDGQAVTCLEEVVTILRRLSTGGARGSPRCRVTACRWPEDEVWVVLVHPGTSLRGLSRPWWWWAEPSLCLAATPLP